MTVASHPHGGPRDPGGLTEPHLELVRDGNARNPSEPQREATVSAGIPQPTSESVRIEDYGFLSDCRSAALVARDGSVDWLCWPRFDSPSLFSRILDLDNGGCFSIKPIAPYVCAHRYVPGTNVLQTTFQTTTGVVRIHDWLDIGARQALCRLVECLVGSVELTLVCDPRPHYAALRRPVWQEERGYLVCGAGDDDRLILQGASAPREPFTLTVGEFRAVSVGWNRPGPSDLFGGLKRTIRFWQDWAADLILPDGISPELAAHVSRSALTLKGLQYQPSGAFVAAPTTSLPERLGGGRNWDYRYSWLRDSAFTVFGLRAVGMHDEAEAWLDWVCETVVAEDDADLQIAYAVDGARDFAEAELPHLAGYRQSRPVRIGNGAARQSQLDVPGALADAIWLGRVSSGRPLTRQRWNLVRSLAERTTVDWRLADNGIWEVRGDPQHFVYSKAMCWVTLDRALRLARADGRSDAPLQRWRSAREAIKNDVLEQGYDRDLCAFTQAYGSGSLDAANLLLAQVGFIAPRDPRFVSTVRAIQRDLSHNGQVYRYRPELTDDGSEGGEGTFTICTLWLCLALHQIGADHEALALFEQTIERANDLRLLSEQLSIEGDQLGNFPQAFSHTAILACATTLPRCSARSACLRIAG